MFMGPKMAPPDGNIKNALSGFYCAGAPAKTQMPGLLKKICVGTFFSCFR